MKVKRSLSPLASPTKRPRATECSSRAPSEMELIHDMSDLIMTEPMLAALRARVQRQGGEIVHVNDTFLYNLIRTAYLGLIVV